MTTKELGNLGEKLACEYLVKKGFNILGKNDRISFGGHNTAPFFGEIDIIARKKWQKLPLFLRPERPIHFIEVKAIIGSEGFFPPDHVNYKKQRKLRQLAHIWLQRNNLGFNQSYQIDIIGIVVNETTRKAKLHYFPNT